ncbi:MAG: insulinase family protein [Bacteroidales bacterium]|nr:insulinase family protein [Bacteroidales bacterium]
MKQVITTIVIAFCAVLAFAQQTQPVPIDAKVRIGKLDNGLTYYIRHNEEPKGQANFYIAQKVGSILEEENQRGLAHFLEHMCFNGTEKFPGNGVVKYCESIGVKFGADLNAYTSIDETVYNIDNVPVATTPSAIDSCLWILHDWADGLLLEGDDIDHERGVIHEEWRSRLGGSATSRMYEKILPEIYPNNKYGQRMPIGLMEVVDNFPYQAIRDYYEKWYRPDQQGIVVVGDIDVDQVEAKIKAIFGTIAKPVNPAERYYVQVEDNQEPIVSIATDKEQPYALNYIFIKHDDYPDSLKGDMTYMIYQYINEIASNILSERTNDLAQQANPPFIQGFIYDEDFFFAKTKGSFNGVVVTDENGVEKGITTIYREMLRALRHGFTASEYERAKANLLSELEKQYNERDKVKSQNYCREYVRHFIDNEPIPGIENEYALAQAILPNIPLEIVNQYMKELVGEGNLVVACMLPEKDGVKYPTKEELISALNKVAAEDIAALEDKSSNEPLIKKMPKAGKVVKNENAQFGYKKLSLSNGAVVYYKNTDFKADEIKMHAFSEGGTSLYGDKDVANLKVIDELIGVGGFGNFSLTELTKALAGKHVRMTPAINTYSETLDGETTPKDVETFLQLNYLYFTAQRADNDAFQSWKSKETAMLVNAATNPMKYLSDTIRKELYPNLPRLKSLTLEDLDQVNYKRCQQICKERFANAADFTFIFTGNIDESTFIPLVEKYIASLPAKGNKEMHKDFGGAVRDGSRENIFKHEMEIPTATVLIASHGKVDYNLKNKLTYSIAEQVIDIVLTEEIREKEGGTYGVSVSAGVNNLPHPYVMMQIYYQTDPEKYEYLNKRIEEVIADFAQNGPSETNMAKVKEYMVKKYQENLRNNGYFSRTMKEYLLNGVDNCTDYEKVLNSITVNDVRVAVADLLKQNNKVKVVMHGIAK